MTIGIYALYWQEKDLIYIGQSSNIEERFINHRSNFKHGHSNHKMAKAFSLYGYPENIILETCGLKDLDFLECFYIKEFKSDKLLNLSDGGTGGTYGFNSGKCPYTEQQLKKCFNLLAEASLSNKEITEYTGVRKDTIDSIKYEKRHSWLYEEYPEIGKKIREHVKLGSYQSLSQENRYKVQVVLLSPNGLEYTCTNGKKFAEQHNLNVGHLNAVIRGAEKQHKGWRLKESEG